MRVLSFLLLLCSISPVAHSDLVVTPTRIDLNEKNRSASITLISQAKDTINYRIQWVEYAMQKDGSYKELTTPRADAKSLEAVLRYSPRQVTLAASETQVIRLSVTNPQSLKDGEYRTHLVFRADPTPFATSDGGKDGISVNLAVAKGIAIPVVFKKGTLSTKVSIDKAKVVHKEKNIFVNFEIQRDGNASPFGDVEIRGLSGEKEESIGLLKGVAVFLETPVRQLEVPITAGESLNKYKKIKIIYTKPAPNAEVLAEHTFNIE